MSIGWELLAGGGVVALAGFFIWLALLNAKKRGAAEALAAASEEARKAEDEMNQIQSETVTDQELRDSFRDGTWGGRKVKGKKK